MANEWDLISQLHDALTLARAYVVADIDCLIESDTRIGSDGVPDEDTMSDETWTMVNDARGDLATIDTAIEAFAALSKEQEVDSAEEIEG